MDTRLSRIMSASENHQEATIEIIGEGHGGPAIIIANRIIHHAQEVIFAGESITIADHCCGIRRGRVGGKKCEECFKPSLVMPFAECLFNDTISREQMRVVLGSQILCDSHYRTAMMMSRGADATFYNRMSISANLIARVFGLANPRDELRYEHILYYLREVVGHLTPGDFACASDSVAQRYVNFNIHKCATNFYTGGALDEDDLDRIARSWPTRERMRDRMRAECAAMRASLLLREPEIFYVAQKRGRGDDRADDNVDSSDPDAPVAKRRFLRMTRSKTHTPTPRPRRFVSFAKKKHRAQPSVESNARHLQPSVESQSKIAQPSVEPAFTRDQLALPHPASMRSAPRAHADQMHEHVVLPAPAVILPLVASEDPIQKAVKAARGFADCVWSSITIGPDGSICIRH